MHNGMQYDTIQGQGHEPFKVGNPVKGLIGKKLMIQFSNSSLIL